MPMKKPSESVVLGGIALVAVVVICLAGFGWEYGWFSSPQIGESTVEITHGISSNEQAKPTGKINVNTASAEELQQLPGIGETLAKAIIAYRTKNGPFTTVTQLLEVEGLGEDTVIYINPYITFES